MFSPDNRARPKLLCGPLESTRPFLFEAAIYWAEQGHRVIYITPTPWQCLPATYHDRKHHSAVAFKLMRFMYLQDYETLIELLVDLHTFEALPSVLLIDDLDTYIRDPSIKESPEVHTARLCAIIQDSTNACSRILKSPVHLCVATSTNDIAKTPYSLYFNDVWRVKVFNDNENGKILEVSRDREDCCEDRTDKVFSYKHFVDGTLVLARISERFLSHE